MKVNSKKSIADAMTQEIYTYNAPWMIYASAFSFKDDDPFRMAIGSFIDNTNNKVQVINFHEESASLKVVVEFNHPFPPTKLMWHPDPIGTVPGVDILASSGDFLRIWEVNGSQGKLRSILNKSSETVAPLTSFDWNNENKSNIVTSSVDSMCTIWDIVQEKAISQIITHDKEVYDVAFSEGQHIFAAVGADGTLRLFDLRNLKNSVIIYETNDGSPLLKLGWNKQDANYVVTMSSKASSPAVVIDIRIPSFPAAELSGHTNAINSVCWAPHSQTHLCTVGDDSLALIWDISDLSLQKHAPILAYQADAPINQIQWSARAPEWVAISYSKSIQMLRT